MCACNQGRRTRCIAAAPADRSRAPIPLIVVSGIVPRLATSLARAKGFRPDDNEPAVILGEDTVLLPLPELFVHLLP